MNTGRREDGSAQHTGASEGRDADDTTLRVPLGMLRLVPNCRPFCLSDVEELADAKAVLLQTAASADRAVVERMLDVALDQTAAICADAWEVYLAVESAAGGLSPEAEQLARRCWALRSRP